MAGVGRCCRYVRGMGVIFERNCPFLPRPAFRVAGGPSCDPKGEGHAPPAAHPLRPAQAPRPTRPPRPGGRRRPPRHRRRRRRPGPLPLRPRRLLRPYPPGAGHPPPTRGDLRAAGDRARPARRPHDRRDPVVAVQRTGEYHRPVPAAARAAGFATRLVHPLTAKQYRPPADPGSQTDDTDRADLGRAAAHGFGRCDPPGPDR